MVIFYFKFILIRSFFSSSICIRGLKWKIWPTVPIGFATMYSEQVCSMNPTEFATEPRT